MQKTILVTGSTDGIGLEAAKILVALGHRVLLHGRNPAKLAFSVHRTPLRSMGRMSALWSIRRPPIC